MSRDHLDDDVVSIVADDDHGHDGAGAAHRPNRAVHRTACTTHTVTVRVQTSSVKCRPRFPHIQYRWVKALMTTGIPCVVIMTRSDTARFTTNMFVGDRSDFVCNENGKYMMATVILFYVYFEEDEYDTAVAEEVYDP